MTAATVNPDSIVGNAQCNAPTIFKPEYHRDTDIAQAIKKFVNEHRDYVNRTLSFGSPLQKAKILLFLNIVNGVSQ